MKNSAVFLIDHRMQAVYVQIDVPEHKDYMYCANYELNLTDNLVYFENFIIPSLGNPAKFHHSSCREVKSINFFARSIDKVWSEDLTVIDFLEKIKRVFKIKEYQLNINGAFDRSQLQPYNMKAMLNVAQAIEQFKLSQSIAV
jgi:hypothetical protein